MSTPYSDGHGGGLRNVELKDVLKNVEEQQVLLRVPRELAGILEDWVDGKRTANIRVEIFNDSAGALVIDNKCYRGILCQLPTIVESVKTYDNNVYYKSGDVHQVLVIDGGEMPSVDQFVKQASDLHEAAGKDPYKLSDAVKESFEVESGFSTLCSDNQLPSGLTAPTRHIYHTHYNWEPHPDFNTVRVAEEWLHRVADKEWIEEVDYEMVPAHEAREALRAINRRANRGDIVEEEEEAYEYGSSQSQVYRQHQHQHQQQQQRAPAPAPAPARTGFTLKFRPPVAAVAASPAPASSFTPNPAPLLSGSMAPPAATPAPAAAPSATPVSLAAPSPMPLDSAPADLAPMDSPGMHMCLEPDTSGLQGAELSEALLTANMPDMAGDMDMPGSPSMLQLQPSPAAESGLTPAPRSLLTSPPAQLAAATPMVDADPTEQAPLLEEHAPAQADAAASPAPPAPPVDPGAIPSLGDADDPHAPARAELGRVQTDLEAAQASVASATNLIIRKRLAKEVAALEARVAQLKEEIGG